jgi:hypothetical protein
LGSCHRRLQHHTMEGAGKDIENGGQKIEDKANENK